MISVTVNAQGTLLALARLGSFLSDTVTPNRQLATQLYSWTIRNYDGRGSLQDAPWVPLAESTRKQKIRLGYSPEPLAPRTGHLRNSFAPFSDATQAGVGARASYGVDYAQVHEEGSGNIPQRKMLPTEKVGLDYAVRIYQNYVIGAQRKAGL